MPIGITVFGWGRSVELLKTEQVGIGVRHAETFEKEAQRAVQVPPWSLVPIERYVEQVLEIESEPQRVLLNTAGVGALGFRQVVSRTKPRRDVDEAEPREPRLTLDCIDRGQMIGKRKGLP